MTQADKDAVDRWLVDTKNPLAYEAGTQTYRMYSIAKEWAERPNV